MKETQNRPNKPLKKSAQGKPALTVPRLLWEQEIGSSNLSTPTLEEPTFLFRKALSNDEAFLFHI